MVVPAALRVLRLKPGRKASLSTFICLLSNRAETSDQFCTLKRISAEVGWGYKDVVDKLEEKRKVKGKAYFERKVGFVDDLNGKKLKAVVFLSGSKPHSSFGPRPLRRSRRIRCWWSMATRSWGHACDSSEAEYRPAQRCGKLLQSQTTRFENVYCRDFPLQLTPSHPFDELEHKPGPCLSTSTSAVMAFGTFHSPLAPCSRQHDIHFSHNACR